MFGFGKTAISEAQACDLYASYTIYSAETMLDILTGDDGSQIQSDERRHFLGECSLAIFTLDLPALHRHFSHPQASRMAEFVLMALAQKVGYEAASFVHRAIEFRAIADEAAKVKANLAVSIGVFMADSLGAEDNKVGIGLGVALAHVRNRDTWKQIRREYKVVEASG